MAEPTDADRQPCGCRPDEREFCAECEPIEDLGPYDLGPLSADQHARLERIEAAPEAEEAIRERVARAIYDAHIDGDWRLTSYKDHYRLLADAAIAVLRGPSVADEALRRVEALAEDYERAAQEARDDMDLFVDDARREYLRRVAAAGDRAADRIRAALNGGDR